jgi:fatty-acyl-CoA synthase
MYERNQRGVASRLPEWLVLARGLKRERIDADGHTIGNNTDELTLRAIWRHWLTLMDPMAEGTAA